MSPSREPRHGKVSDDLATDTNHGHGHGFNEERTPEELKGGG
jgi:hypothetical protein